MTIVTRQEFRNLESKAIQGYSWYIKGATLKQEVAFNYAFALMVIEL